jgi:hypothetical protein
VACDGLRQRLINFPQTAIDAMLHFAIMVRDDPAKNLV